MRTWLCPGVLVIGLTGWVSAQPDQAAPLTRATEWRFDNLSRVGGHDVTLVGAPVVVQTDRGPAVSFNGSSDGLLIEANPLAGLARFSLEVVFRPAAGGPEEQRFVHVQESASENRALVELRMTRDGQWALDTFLRSPARGLTLLDRSKTHPAGRWHVATLTYDGRTMAHYVDGVRELSGEVAFEPLGAGRTSIGMRQNRVSWFKGEVHAIRVSPQQARTIPLWPEGVPNLRPDAGDERRVDGRVTNVHHPSLTYVPPSGPPNGTAVIVCPGGGFARLALANEADGITAVLSPAGVSTFVLKYRLAEYGHPAPLQDVLRAVRLVRSLAGELGVVSDRIGVMGASAGGHVAAAAATLYDAPEGRAGGPLDAVSGRPDFAALLYPVITMADPFAHLDSRRNLLGAAPAPEAIHRLSLDQHVTPRTPPVFLVHTREDRSVPLEHSLLFFSALRRAGVSAEMHLYDRGEHGFGTRRDLGPTSGWTDRWLDWMRAHGWLTRSAESRR